MKSFAQKDSSILLFPIKAEAIVFDREIRSMLQYNKVQPDSAKKFILNLMEDNLKNNFPNFKVQNFDEFKQTSFNKDSLQYSDQMTSTVQKRIEKSKGYGKMILMNDSRRTLKYYGCIVDSLDSIQLKQMTGKYNFNYVLFLNKLEMVPGTRLDNNTRLILNFDIYNQDLSKINGDKCFADMDVSIDMYFNVFQYFLPKAINELLIQFRKTEPMK